MGQVSGTAEPFAFQSVMAACQGTLRGECFAIGAFIHQETGGVPCRPTTSKNWRPFETMSKRRRGFPSEVQVKRGMRIVHGDKLLEEKLGRNDLCPCGSGRRFKKCCLATGCF